MKNVYGPFGGASSFGVGFLPIAPPLFQNTSTFYASTVTSTAHISPALVADADTVYAAAVTSTSTASIPFVSDGDTFYAASVGWSVTVPYVTDADAFYAPTLSALFSVAIPYTADGDVFYAATLASTAAVAAPFVSDADTTYGHTVTTSATIAVSFVGDADAVYSPSFTQIILAALFDNSGGAVVYQPTVAPATWTIAPSLSSFSETAFGPVVYGGSGIIAPYFADADAFYAATVSATATVSVPLFTDIDAVYGPKIDLRMSAPFFADPEAFYTVALTTSATVVAPLVSLASVVYGPAVYSINHLIAPLHFEPQEFQQVSVLVVAGLTIRSNIYVDPDDVYLPVVGTSAAAIDLGLSVTLSEIYGPRIRRRMTCVTQATPTQSQIQAALREFLECALPEGVDVIIAQANRVPEPDSPDFVLMTPLRYTRLGTNVSDDQDVVFSASIAGSVLIVGTVEFGTIEVGAQLFGEGVAEETYIVGLGTGTGGAGTYIISAAQVVGEARMSAGRRRVEEGVEVVVQIDFHSDSMTVASGMARTVSQLMRDSFAVDKFASQDPNYGVFPLHADNPRQAPFINEGQQYEWRWILEASLQVDQVVIVPQEYADRFTIVPKSVDVVAPPG